MLKFFKYFVLIISALFLVTVIVIYIGANYSGSRPLSEKEKNIAKSIYKNEIDLDKVKLVFDTVYCKDSTKVLGNTIHFNTNTWGLDIKEADSADFDPLTYKYLLIHELGHVWQYQTKGWGYIPKSLIAQGVARIRTGSRSNAYNWEDRLFEGKKWEELNPEEQAESISDYFYYRELGDQASSEQSDFIKKLECFIPFLVNSLCESEG
ncbi:MAG: hypothetical protein Q8Q89_04295 [bacterium]|nr:hypothetical protein [bacterium]